MLSCYVYLILLAFFFVPLFIWRPLSPLIGAINPLPLGGPLSGVP